ncbi:MAG: sulfotransferase domain-containing protein [Deltaproteobacteria bacterium]|nr:sulfotransferase domain-containing protein [Deltaproteobacteria bacterium]
MRSAEPPELGVIQRVTMDVRNVLKPRMSVLRERWSPVERAKNRRADAFLVWFPKTGGTWMRIMLSRAMSLHSGHEPADPLTFESFPKADPSLPYLRWLHDDEPHWKRPEQLTANKERYRGRKVILLVRDPRDTVVSLYFQMTRRWKVCRCTLDEFIRQPRGSIRTMIRYYDIWAEHRNVPERIELFRYRDVHADPHGSLRRALDLLGLSAIDDGIVAQAVRDSSFESLRRQELGGVHASSRLRPGRRGDSESLKVRRGKVGGYRDYLDEAQIAWIDEQIGSLDAWYGY